MYLVLAVAGGVIGGVLSMGIRAELMQPGLQVFGSSDAYNLFVSAHGLIMIFFTLMSGLRCLQVASKGEINPCEFP